MSNKNDEAIEAAVELTKLAYEDAFQPLAKEVGKIGGTIGQAVNLALEPARGVVWGYEKTKAYVTSKVSEKLENRKVKAEDIVTPDPDIAVPSIEALRYTKLKDEFANLIASAMDKNNSGKIHPSFVDLLKQITSDEALILKYLSKRSGPFPFVELRKFRIVDGKEKGFTPLGDSYGTVAKDAKCSFPNNVNSYMINLFRLGLLEKVDLIKLRDENAYKKLFSENHYGKSFLDEKNKEFQYEKRVYRKSALGKLFLKYCL